MTLRAKLVGIVALVALIPLVVVATTALEIHQRALDGALATLHGKLAEHGAETVTRYFESTERTLRLAAGAIDWPTLDARERDGALWLLYRQLPDIAVVALLDQDGEGIGESVYRVVDSADNALSDHPPADVELLRAFARNVPLTEARRDGYAIGTAFASAAFRRPLLPVVLRVQGKGGAWFIAVVLSLARTCDALVASVPSGTTTVAVDGRGRAMCGDSVEPFATSPNIDPPKQTTVTRRKDTDGSEHMIAASPAPIGWWVTAEQPVHMALAASQHIRAQAVVWTIISLLVAVGAGLALARSVSRPVAELVRGALELARGNFAHRSSVDGNDELGRLGATFNHMSEEVERRDREIRAWNVELQGRVEERTAALREAQAQLLQAQKMAAMTSLGAGVAHEINNPLTGVLGIIQLLRAKMGKEGGAERARELLDVAEKESWRIRDIVQRFLALSQDQAGKGFAPVDVHAVIEETLSLAVDALAKAGVRLSRRFASDLPMVVGNGAQLRQAFLEIVKNAGLAMPQGGELTISTSCLEDKVVQVVFADTGRGIAAENLEKIFDPFFSTKDETWRGEGLGLTVAFKLVGDHHGTIKAKSVVGEGTTMIVTLPAGARRAHLV